MIDEIIAFFLRVLVAINREFWKLIAVLFLFLIIWGVAIFFIKGLTGALAERLAPNIIWMVSIACLISALGLTIKIILKAMKNMDLF